MKKFKKGFTLIELLVVIAIIAILAVVVIVALTGSKDKANTAAARKTADGIMPQVVMAYTDGGGIQPPADTSIGGGSICSNCSSTVAWPSIAKTGYIYNVVADTNISDGNYSFTLTKTDQPTVTVALIGGVASITVAGGSGGSGGNFTCGTSTVGGYGTVVVGSTTCWLDRNLGAASVGDTGGFYQWGRGSDGHQAYGSAIQSPSNVPSASSTPGHGNFILITDIPRDWLSPQNGSLWNGLNGTNNPCPTGFRVPSSGEMNTMFSNLSIGNTSSAASSSLKLPAGGYRLANTGGYSAVSNGFYWTADTYGGNYSMLKTISASNITDISHSRADGALVRCIKD